LCVSDLKHGTEYGASDIEPKEVKKKATGFARELWLWMNSVLVVKVR
jgi:hypothetical protein